MSMWARIRNWGGRWRRVVAAEATPREAALLPRAFISVLEDVLAWDNPQLSLGFIAIFNVLFLVLMQLSVSWVELIFMAGMFSTLTDALEAWLRHKHRTALLKQLAECDNTRLHRGLVKVRRWLFHRKEDFLAMRQTNPTKAFLLVNIILAGVLVVGRAVSGALLLYLLSMSVLLFPVARPYLNRLVKKIHQVAESDGEIDSLIPELSENNLKELNFESEAPVDTRRTIDSWLPEGAPPTDSSDSSEEEDVRPPLPGPHPALEPRDSSDSSEDEYLPEPLQETERLRSTLEIVKSEPASWSGGAVSALLGLRGALSALAWSARAAPATPAGPAAPRKPLSSPDSSDGFEFIDQSDL